MFKRSSLYSIALTKCIQLRGDKIADWRIKLELELKLLVILNFTYSLYICNFQGKNCSNQWSAFFISVLTKAINLVSKKEQC